MAIDDDGRYTVVDEEGDTHEQLMNSYTRTDLPPVAV